MKQSKDLQQLSNEVKIDKKISLAQVESKLKESTATGTEYCAINASFEGVVVLRPFCNGYGVVTT